MLRFDDWQSKAVNNIITSSIKEFSFSSPERVTKIKKIIISSSVGQVVTNKQYLENTRKCLESIVDQKVVTKLAKKSVFKIREGTPISCMVTLRGIKMWNFFFKLIHLYIPRIRDLRGFSKSSFDNDGNYNFGISDLTIFHEVPYELTFKNQGLQINIVFSSNVFQENVYYLEYLKFPFKK